jgi:hypothetical protein
MNSLWKIKAQKALGKKVNRGCSDSHHDVVVDCWVTIPLAVLLPIAICVFSYLMHLSTHKIREMVGRIHRGEVLFSVVNWDEYFSIIWMGKGIGGDGAPWVYPTWFVVLISS